MDLNFYDKHINSIFVQILFWDNLNQKVNWKGFTKYIKKAYDLMMKNSNYEIQIKL